MQVRLSTPFLFGWGQFPASHRLSTAAWSGVPRWKVRVRALCHAAVMSNERHRTCTREIIIRPAHGPERGRPVRARRRGGKDRAAETHELLDDALDRGLVSGDVVSCLADEQHRRYLVGIESLRNGTLGALATAGHFCPRNLAAMVEQTTRDWRATGCESVHTDGSGLLSGFWPASVPTADVDLALARSAAEFGLDGFLTPLPDRLEVIEFRVDLSLPHAVGARVFRTLPGRHGRDRETGPRAA